EGAGAISTWTLSLTPELRSFDYMTISDVILHIRYTARRGGDGKPTTDYLKRRLGDGTGQGMMFNLPYHFSTEWAAFIGGTRDLSIRLRKDRFPYLAQTAKKVQLLSLVLYLYTAGDGGGLISETIDPSMLSDTENADGPMLTIKQNLLPREASQV